MKKTIIAAAVFFITAIAPIKLYGWGGGHDYVNRLALTVMPSEIKSFLGVDNSEKFVEWSHAPDDFTPWVELKNVSICAEDMEVLDKWKMKHPYSLHSHEGHAVNFILLIKSFQSNDPQRAAYWMSTLMHTVADEIACNHDPLIHIMTYGFKEYGLNMSKGIGVDFADVAKTTEGASVIQELLKGVKVVPVAETAQSALLKVMMSGIEGNAFMTERGSRIAASFSADTSDSIRQDSIKAMAELGVRGIQESLNTILTAWNFARQDLMPVLNDEVFEEYKIASAEFVLKRDLRQDSLFTELLDTQTESKPYAGALVEPSISMNKAKLGFSSKLITASIARTLRDNGKDCRLIDIRKVESDGFPSPEEMPVLIVCAGNFNVSKEVEDQFAGYIRSGGKLLWIGGEHKDQLGDLSKNMKRVDDTLLPVSNKYGKDSPVIKNAVVIFQSELRKVLGEKEYHFTHNPNTKAGWQKPVCLYMVNKETDGVISLAELKVDDKVMTIAAAGKSSGGDFQYIFLPEYLISPYLLSEETVIKDPSRPVLDSVGTKILLSTIAVLVPDN